MIKDEIIKELGRINEERAEQELPLIDFNKSDNKATLETIFNSPLDFLVKTEEEEEKEEHLFSDAEDPKEEEGEAAEEVKPAVSTVDRSEINDKLENSQRGQFRYPRTI